ncbi:MAG: hypothetical protein ABIH08_03255, partial [Candidatus Omnitrophota bacterium]
EIIPFIEPYFEYSSKNTSYSFISILTGLGLKNPNLIYSFIKKAEVSSSRTASIYLDAIQGISLSDEPKIPYFYLREEGKLSTDEIKKAALLLKDKYLTGELCPNGQM